MVIGVAASPRPELDEVLDEDWDVLRAVPQRWDMDAEGGDALQQVWQERSIIGELLERNVRRSNEPHIRTHAAIGTHWPDLTVLYGMEQLPLHARRCLPDLVEE